MVEQFLGMPGGLRLFLVYALTILFGIGISLRYVIDQAIGAPVSGPGIVVMVLLAYTIFTTTLVIQRKQAARGLALGLASLTLPLTVYLLAAGLIPQTVFFAALAALLFRGLLRDEVRPISARSDGAHRHHDGRRPPTDAIGRLTVPLPDLRGPELGDARTRVMGAACLPTPNRDEARPNREQGITPRGQAGAREPTRRTHGPPAG